MQFKIVSRSDGRVEDYEQGWKDTLYVPRGDSATFIAKFDDYASDTAPFMYHCHMANHEDGGLMGQFLVVKDPATLSRDSTGAIRFRDRVEHPLTPKMIAGAERQSQTSAPYFATADLAGKVIYFGAPAEQKPMVLFFIERECPCSRDAAPFFNQLQAAYGTAGTVVGVINADSGIAREWVKQSGATFPIVADPKLTIIHAYGAERSAYTTVIAPGGKILKTYPGYSAQTLKELSATLARLGGVAEKPLPFDKAPRQFVVGCSLEVSK